MSAAAIQLLDHLRENGVEDGRAVKMTESEEKAKVQFVTVDEYHKRDRTLATREDIHTEIAALRADHRADMAELRAEVRATNRLILGGFVTLTAGVVALVAKLYLGV